MERERRRRPGVLIHQHLEYWADRQPRTIAATDHVGRSWTYAELEQRATRLGRALHDAGFQPSTRLAVLAENCLDWLAIYFAAFKFGLVVVPLNYRLAEQELARLLHDARPRALIAQEKFTQLVDGLRPRLRFVESFVVIGHRHAWTSLDELSDRGHQGIRSLEFDDEAPLLHIYSSGTTGTPKGTVLSHAAVTANTAQILLPLALNPGDEVLVTMPLCHASAAVRSLAYVARGCRIDIEPRFDANRCVEIMDQRPIAFASFAPTMIRSMLDDVAGVTERSYERLAVIGYGTSSIDPRALRRAAETFRCDFVQAYGMTEASCCVTLLSTEDHRTALTHRPELLRSCGRPVLATSIRIVNSGGDLLPTGQRGQVIVRGPQLMTGYWADLLAGHDSLNDGWLHTGDEGYLDDDGYLYITDRLKDVIVTGGLNVSSRDVEDIIQQMPGVADCAVVGVPDDRWGERVLAVVVPSGRSSIEGIDVITWCRHQLAHYKCPSSVAFVDTLPRNVTGKVLKRVLRGPNFPKASST